MDRKDLWDRTIVVVLSDHGEEFWEHFDLFGKHCHSLYNELLEVPFLLRHPGMNKMRVVEDRVSLVDLVPTLADLLGLEWNEQADGISLVPLIDGGDVERVVPVMAAIAHRAHGDGVCVIDNNVKYMEVVYKEERKRLHFSSDSLDPPGTELYHLDSDPRERANLAESEQFLAQAMAETLKAATKRALPPITSVSKDPDVSVSGELKKQLQVLGYLSSY